MKGKKTAPFKITYCLVNRTRKNIRSVPSSFLPVLQAAAVTAMTVAVGGRDTCKEQRKRQVTAVAVAAGSGGKKEEETNSIKQLLVVGFNAQWGKRQTE